MKLKYLALLAAMSVAGQSWALSAYEKHMGCNHEVGNCPDQGGGGGGGDGASSYTGAWIYAGSLWESFEDKQGGFDIETKLATGEKIVHLGNVAGFLIKPPPPNSNMKRSALVYGALTSAQTLAETKKKAEAEKLAAAAKAAADAAAAANKAAAVYQGPAIGSQPAGGGMVATARKKP